MARDIIMATREELNRLKVIKKILEGGITQAKKVLNLYKEKYPDFGPTLFCEKLYELHRIAVSKETARKWLLEEGLWRRERKPCFGEMLQLDGPHHDWFEKRRDKAVLMAFIDAVGMVYARFYEYEGKLSPL